MSCVVNLDRQDGLLSGDFSQSGSSCPIVSDAGPHRVGRNFFMSAGSVPKRRQRCRKSGVSFESREMARMQNAFGELQGTADGGSKSESQRSHTGHSSSEVSVLSSEIAPIKEIVSRQQNLTESTLALSEAFTVEHVEKT